MWTTTNVLSNNPDPVASCEGTKPSVSPTLTAEVHVEGKSAKALIDTGLLVSLISIDFLLQALLPVVGEDKTLSEKVEALQARMQSPSMGVRNFGGHQVNVICQTTVTLSHRKHKHQVANHTCSERYSTRIATKDRYIGKTEISGTGNRS